MSKNPSLFIEEDNLSLAWAKSFAKLIESGVQEITPLVVTVTGFTNGCPMQNTEIQKQLDSVLLKNNKFPINTVANTLFPQSLWNPNTGRSQLFERYMRLLPIIKRNSVQNRYGLYFERLIAYGVGSDRMNQLDHIIRTYHNRNRRRSALQASIFLPERDHTDQIRRGFPCMQHVAFTPYNDGELAVTGFYASQYIFERAYGNYLGLCNLGRFMAHEMDLRLTRMTCVASVAMLGTEKNKVRELSTFINKIIS